jgi:hypothetical protein
MIWALKKAYDATSQFCAGRDNKEKGFAKVPMIVGSGLACDGLTCDTTLNSKSFPDFRGK